VRDDVVQLTRDPRALLDDGGTGPLLPIQLELVGPLRVLAGREPPAVQVAA
jgi:hypothetical protein